MLELLALLAVVAIIGTILGVVLLTVVLAFKLAVSVVLLPFKLIAFPVVAVAVVDELDQLIRDAEKLEDALRELAVLLTR